MRMLYEQFFVLPMPVLWLLLGGFVFCRWRSFSRVLFTTGTIVLLLACLPATGKLMIRGLAGGVLPLEQVDRIGLAAVVVPTGGSYDDGAGRWWPLPNSIKRAVAGRQLASRLGVPLILVGGSPLAGQPAESVTVARALGLTNTDVVLGTTARDSAESSAEVASLLASQSFRRVALVTNTVHIARMRATLRHNGFEVVVVLAPRQIKELDWKFKDLVPSRGGLGMTSGALQEYAGILWYLATDRIEVGDL